MWAVPRARISFIGANTMTIQELADKIKNELARKRFAEKLAKLIAKCKL